MSPTSLASLDSWDEPAMSSLRLDLLQPSVEWSVLWIFLGIATIWCTVLLLSTAWLVRTMFSMACVVERIWIDDYDDKLNSIWWTMFLCWRRPGMHFNIWPCTEQCVVLCPILWKPWGHQTFWNPIATNRMTKCIARWTGCSGIESRTDASCTDAVVDHDFRTRHCN